MKKTSLDMPFGLINVYSKTEEIIANVINSPHYINKFSDMIYNVYFEKEFHDIDNSYRAKQMQKGIYLGHNIGKPCNLKIDGETIYLYSPDFTAKDYQKVFWTFLIKYILTDASLKNNAEHFKGTLIRCPDNKLIVFLGRGGSGKTTIAQKLQNYNYKLLSNTHCILKDDYIWGINSWVRIRNNQKKDSYYIDLNPGTLEGHIHKFFIVEYNTCGAYNETILNNSYFSIYFKYFSSAIVNYDLKEEVLDYSFKKNIITFTKSIEQEDKSIKQICNSDVKLISVDVNHTTALFQLLKTLSDKD